MVPQVCQDLWALKVHKVQLVSQDPLACQVLAKQVNLEFPVPEEPLVLLELLVKKASQVQQALLVNLVLQVP